MHRSSTIREALQDFLDSDIPANEFVVEDELNHDIEWLLGKLYHCTEVVPAGYCDQLDFPAGSLALRPRANAATEESQQAAEKGTEQ